MYPVFKYICLASIIAPRLACAGERGFWRTVTPDIVFARGGFSATNLDDAFREYRLGAGWNLTDSDFFSDTWIVQPGIEVSAGYLESHGEGAFVAGAGVSLLFGYKDFPLFLEGSFCPTCLSRKEFSAANLGSEIQFTSSAGITWKINDSFSVGYRFQHMSNAHLNPSNPGVDLHVLAAAFRF